MKIALSKIVGRPIVVGGSVAGYEFVEALKKLAADPLPVKERYALARTIEDAERWVASFEAARLQEIKNHCMTRKDFLTSRRTKLEREIEEASKGEAKHPGLKRMQESLVRLEMEIQELGVATGGYVAPGPESERQLEAAVAKHASEEVDLFLDHRIKLGDESKLDGNQMRALMELIEVQ